MSSHEFMEKGQLLSINIRAPLIPAKKEKWRLPQRGSASYSEGFSAD
jgi:hypothetical protein